MDERYRAIKDNPRFRALVEERGRFATTLSIVMLAIYLGFILVIAFVPGLFGLQLGAGVTTLGIPIGVAVILSAFVLTGIYVWKANTTFDSLNRQILEESRR
jgi:uncharacterized membrane protein (DUF485 family)